MLSELTKLDRKLREVRQARMLTQEQLAQGAGLGIATIRNIERGEAEHPRRRTMEALATALGVRALDLADDTLSTAQVLRRAEKES